MADDPTRKLAVLLHADVVGSTALVQLNEVVAHERIRDVFRHFSEIITSYSGIAHEIRGDAIVAEFSRTSDAVSAALGFQIANAERNEELTDEIRPVLRVGIAMGEVVIADNTVTGEGIVMAQRLEQMAEPGGVYVQGAAYETMPTRLPFDYENLGEMELKGFHKPVRVYAVTQECQATRSVSKAPIQPSAVELGLPDKPSIAVLPFTNMSDDIEQEYFSDGIAEDLITELTHFSDMLVIARNSSFRYRGNSVDIKQVGRELGVRYVLEGSVRKGGDRVRITVQLIDSLTNNQIWAARYDRILDDVFTMQDEIVKQVVSTVAGQVNVAETSRSKGRPTNSLSAYDCYLRGLQCSQYFSYGGDLCDEWSRAKNYFEQAVSLDPEYADALAELALVHLDLSLFGPDSGTIEKAGEFAERAVIADGGNATAHSALGMYHLDSGNHDKAEHHFEQSMRLNSNQSRILGEYCTFLGNSGQTDEAVAMAQSAILRDPYHPEWLYDALGEAYWLGGRYEEAISAYGKLMAKPYWVHCDLACCYAYLGRVEEAKVHVQAFRDGMPEDWSAEDEVDWEQGRLRYEADKKHHLEGWRKAGLID